MVKGIKFIVIEDFETEFIVKLTPLIATEPFGAKYLDNSLGTANSQISLLSMEVIPFNFATPSI